MNRPLLISDCDEVLLHLVVPFETWLNEAHGIDFNLESGEFIDALRHKATGELVHEGDVWPLLQSFFVSEMHRQAPTPGAVEAINAIREHGDVVVLTNLTDEFRDARSAQLRSHGIDIPVYTNQGGKGDALARIIAEYQPSVAVFVDDLPHQIVSVAKAVPDVFRLHMVGEPRVSPAVKSPKSAHVRIDDWASAQAWIMDRFKGVSL